MPDEIHFHGEHEGLVGVRGPDGGWFIYRPEPAKKNTGDWAFVEESQGVPKRAAEPDPVSLVGEIMAAEIEAFLNGE